MMTSFRFPTPPFRGRDRSDISTSAIANDHFIIMQRYVDRSRRDCGLSYVYDRYRNHWYGPLQIAEEARTIGVDLLRFVGSHFFLFRVVSEPSTVASDAADIVLARLSSSLQEASIVMRCRLQTPLLDRCFPLLHGNQLSVMTCSHSSCCVYDVGDTTPVLLDVFTTRRRAVYATQRKKNIFIVCRPGRRNGKVTLKAYNLDRRRMRMIRNYVPQRVHEPLTLDDAPTEPYAFGSVRNLLITLTNYGGIQIYVFHLALQQPLFQVFTIADSVGHVFDTGEALLYNYRVYIDESSTTFTEIELECKWILPPKLADIAMRVIHASMPSATKGLLKKSNVDSTQALVRYLLLS